MYFGKLKNLMGVLVGRVRRVMVGVGRNKGNWRKNKWNYLISIIIKKYLRFMGVWKILIVCVLEV